MQLTRFDRWLREKFVYETHIYTLRPPARMPKGIKERRRYKAPRGSRYQHLYIPKTDVASTQLIRLLKAENQLFATKVVERKSWYAPLLAPEGRSVTWGLVSTVVILTAVISVFLYIQYLWSDPEIRQNLLDAVEVLKG